VSKPLYRRKRLWTAAAVAAVAAVAVLFRQDIAALLSRIGWEDIRNSILASGPWAPLVCILLYGLCTVAFLPTTLVGVLVALLFGPWLGLPICLAGLGLGMGLAFLISRHLLHEWIERRIGHTRLYRRIEEHMRTEGWKLIIFTRLLPINPFCFVNYAYGLTRIPFWVYLAASLIGVIPNTVALLWTTHAAGRLAAGQSDGRILVLLFAAALIFALLAWLPRFLRRRLPDALPEPGDDILPDP